MVCVPEGSDVWEEVSDVGRGGEDLDGSELGECVGHCCVESLFRFWLYELAVSPVCLCGEEDFVEEGPGGEC